jgi:hypothetical protein
MSFDEDQIGPDELPKKTSSFIRGSDLVGKIVKATIAKTGTTTFSDGRRARTLYVVLDGESDEKSFSLNKNNTTILAAAYGAKVSNWTGKKISLTATQVNHPITKQQVAGILVVAG